MHTPLPTPWGWVFLWFAGFAVMVGLQNLARKRLSLDWNIVVNTVWFVMTVGTMLAYRSPQGVI